MNPFGMKKKKPFGEEPDEPEALDAPKKPPMQAAAEPPMSADPMNGAPAYRPKAAPTMDEPPVAEMSEGDNDSDDYGAKLVADISAVMEAHGIEESQGRALASDLFGAIAECLGRSAGAGQEQPEQGAAATEGEAY
jgi:hypothetical protein